MPCKLKTFRHRETCSESNDIRKSKHPCIVEADESARKGLERNLSEDREDHIAGEGFKSLSHYNLVHDFTPMLQAMKIPDAKTAVNKEWKKLEKVAALVNDQSKEQNEGHPGSTKRSNNSPFLLR